MYNFKAGDKVRCIDSVGTEYVDGGGLKQGAVYTVVGWKYPDARMGLVLKETGVTGWAPIRFELVDDMCEPYVVTNEQVFAFDIDDTLVLWEADYFTPGENKLRIVDPYDGAAVYLKPHARHVKLVKQWAGRGRYVLVWSQGGAAWAEAVIRALGLETYVHLILTKPLGYVDDLPAEKWLNQRIFLDEVGA